METRIATPRNTYAKRQREQEKKQRAESKRARREKRKNEPVKPAPLPDDLALPDDRSN